MELPFPARLAALGLSLFVCLASATRAPALEFSTVVFENKPHTVCKVDLRKEKLELFLRDDSGRPLKRFSALAELLASRGRKVLFAMNAGMYHGDFSPVGLCVATGMQLAPLNLEPGEGNFFLKPNGVFLITSRGAAIMESSRVSTIREPILMATQSGPMLVIDGTLHPAFRRDSTSELYRNGVGITSPHDVIFVISEAPVNFHHFARLFRDRLGCQNALFFDGTISSLHSAELKRSDFRMDLGPMIAITAPE